MSKDATLQIRMDSALKSEAEELFRNMGTSFAEAVRIFAKRSVELGAMPFAVKTSAPFVSKRGMLAKYADPSLMSCEKDAWEKAAVEKYEAD